MSTTLFAVFGLLAPIHGLLRGFSKAKVQPLRFKPPAYKHPGNCALAPMPEPEHRARGRPAACARSRANTPLRVVRLMDSGQAAHGGRMMISGRMADVCAELDRMAAREAAIQYQPPAPAR